MWRNGAGWIAPPVSRLENGVLRQPDRRYPVPLRRAIGAEIGFSVRVS